MVSSIVKKQIIAVVAVCCLLWSLFLIRFSTTIHYLNEESSTTTSSISILPINVTTHTTSNNNNNNNKQTRTRTTTTTRIFAAPAQKSIVEAEDMYLELATKSEGVLEKPDVRSSFFFNLFVFGVSFHEMSR